MREVFKISVTTFYSDLYIRNFIVYKNFITYLRNFRFNSNLLRFTELLFVSMRGQQHNEEIMRTADK